MKTGLVESENGNIITERGRFDLYELDENNIPVKKVESFRQPGSKGVVIASDKQRYFNKNLKEREPQKKHEPNTSLGFFEKIKAKYYHIKMDMEAQMLETIKKFIGTKLIQWIMKAIGGTLAGYGISQGSAEEIIYGAVAFIISAIWSLISTGKIALTPPNEFQKLK